MANMSKKQSNRSISWFDSPDRDRKRRIATYKMYAKQGKVKTTFNEGIRWIKRKCSNLLHHY
ncbi:hypothetical protein DCAR_0206068 [Daucus carota subsp. sativus]|uniref:DUF3511 domain-containing protein n=1 Tax=Daucus carota subsp. sativus TaxID=79200 RepID=A0AAF1AKS3_DAUCS|nr:hypothetical protein DCAR_0206068 [Daucus carota subsp. sativus]